MKKLDVNPGDRYSRLTIVKEVERKNKVRRRFLCQCDCGNTKEIDLCNLNNGNTSSCGCLWKEVISKSSVTHGLSGTRIYRSWAHMLGRCGNENDKRFEHYGERGIEVCEEWLDFQNFYDWATENGYSDELTIDRIDVNGNYEPSNCRWATWKEQQNNRRNNRLITFNNETLTSEEWADRLGIDSGTIRYRLSIGWTVKDALMKPARKNKLISFKGRKQNINDWADELGFNKGLINKRLKLGWGIEKALTTPVQIQFQRFRNED